MTTFEACRSDLLIFAVEESTRGIDTMLSRLMGDVNAQAGLQTMVVKTPGEALRLVHRHQPKVLFFCMALADFERSAPLVDVVHRRQPRLPLIAIAPVHDEAIERAVRAAGASYYFALDDEDAQLRRVLHELGLAPPVGRSGLSPPGARAAPRVRRRVRRPFVP